MSAASLPGCLPQHGVILLLLETLTTQNMLKQHKIELLDYVRTTSVGCTQQPSENALMCLRSGDLRAFVDIINNPDVEAGSGSEEALGQPARGG